MAVGVISGLLMVMFVLLLGFIVGMSIRWGEWFWRCRAARKRSKWPIND